ncbi:hypothetical protein D3C75_1229430 [compost metagenome]
MGINVIANHGVTATARRPVSSPLPSASTWRALAICATSNRASTSNFLPTSVNTIPEVCRISNCVAVSASSFCRALVTAAGEVSSRLAAPRILPASATATRALS